MSRGGTRVPAPEVLLQHLPHHVVVIDRQRRMLFFNAGEASGEAPLGLRFDEFVSDADRPRVVDIVEQAFATGEIREIETLIHTPKRGDVWFFAKVIPLGREPGSETAIVFAEDINERRRTQQQLAESEARLRSMFDHTPDFVVVIDEERRVEYINKPPPPETGLTKDDVVGMQLDDLVQPEFRTQAVGLIEHSLATQEPTQYEGRGVGSDKSWVTRVVPIVIERDTTHLLLITTDLTDLARARQQLEESQERLETAVSAADIGLWRWSLVDDTVEWDDHTCAIYRVTEPPRSQSELLGLVHADDRQRLERDLRGALQDGSLLETRHRIVTADGETRWLLVRGRVQRADDGGARGIMGGVLDVTSSHLMQEQLQQAHKLDAVGKLAGGVAHDFNNLMLVVEANVDIAKHSSSEHELGQALDEIRAASRRAQELTRQLLSYSSTQPAERVTVDARSIVQDVVRMLQRLLPESIELVVEGQLGGNIAAEATQLSQVLVNLCVNARDAMPAGGKLRIETTPVDVDADFRKRHGCGSGPYVRIAVSDTGEGMPPEVQARAFEPFFTTKAPGAGTGLGLSIAYSVVKQHQGVVTLHSEPGQGSTVSVYLPLSTSSPSAASSPVDVEPRGGTESVLVVEDDKLVRSAIRRILSRAGYEVVEASNGREAIEVVDRRGDDISLIVMDSVMPVLGGRDAIKAIRGAGNALPIILSSGYDTRAADVLQDPLVHLLGKPYAPEDLLRLVRRLLDASVS